ncbi:hypothetical protein K437DRAFT_258904 [Tilletiaria anomala UBC 951]|uniref:ATPase inhibitor, mitochondrial n=1 Tax=Tilletiaria anomala (strain ATCC 24038 / CBS 436.72 / UBC 951) TaxID=1037660 RepID=A0A066VEL1_TILAU|nr:uncharacterized protein K437DRAFT_258904 [Tilletiaria anomala UBC 951]KDN39856.1 hypothetical protein K437DRAFT_258904 [Tilletiaria anomala UBC 951]
MLSLTAIRSAAAIRCSSVTNARWAAGTVRMYSDKPGSAGATAQSTTFKNREQAQEAHYIKQQEADKIRKRECRDYK